MAKVQTLFIPIKVLVTQSAPLDSFKAGDLVRLDTNIPGVVIFTLDGSLPVVGRPGTFRLDAPVTLKISTFSTLKFFAIDSRDGRNFNRTKIQAITYRVTRTRPVEEFRDNKHFFNRLTQSTVDHNFYAGGGWTVPASTTKYTYLFKQPESKTAQTRLLLNGVDELNFYPVLSKDQTFEFPITVNTGSNEIQVQTANSISG